jgi:hypothetical protein
LASEARGMSSSSSLSITPELPATALREAGGGGGSTLAAAATAGWTGMAWVAEAAGVPDAAPLLWWG